MDNISEKFTDLKYLDFSLKEYNIKVSLIKVIASLNKETL